MKSRFSITPQLIGEGAQGKVFEALLPDSNRLFVAKICPLISSEDESNWNREIEYARKAGEVKLGPVIHEAFVCKDLVASDIFVGGQVPNVTFRPTKVSLKSTTIKFGIMIADRICIKGTREEYTRRVYSDTEKLKESLRTMLYEMIEHKLWNDDLGFENILFEFPNGKLRPWIVDWGATFDSPSPSKKEQWVENEIEDFMSDNPYDFDDDHNKKDTK